MKLAVSQPREEFHAGPNIKFYPWYMHPWVQKYIDDEDMQKTPWTIITEIPEGFDPRAIPFHLNTRHQESDYNTYKEYFITTQLRKNFLNESNLRLKEKLTKEILINFKKSVWIDQKTWLSKDGHEKWKESTEFYNKFWADPDLKDRFPTKIMVSPYDRAKETLLYALKWIDWLSIDLSSLDPKKKSNEYYSWMTIWDYRWKKVVLKEMDIIRERNHWYIGAPRFVTEELNKFYAKIDKDQSASEFMSTLLTEEEKQIEHYFNGPNWWESMTETNDRAEAFNKYRLQLPDPSTWTCSHHLSIVSTQLKAMWGGYQNFRNFNDNRRPANGSLTIMVNAPVTESGQKDKLRTWIYSAMPTL